jgi:hypothetical protein
VKEMVTRDVNHPCVELWSHGNARRNQSGATPNLNNTIFKAAGDPSVRPNEGIQTDHNIHYDNGQAPTGTCKQTPPHRHNSTALMPAALERKVLLFGTDKRHIRVLAGGFPILCRRGGCPILTGTVTWTRGAYAPDGILGPNHEK